MKPGLNYLLIKRSDLKNKKKLYILFIIYSLAGFFVFAVLHNLASALLSQLLNKEIEEPVFFLLATIVSPIALIVGVLGTIFEFSKNKKDKK